MLDTKRILQLGIGVAVGMVAYHFISKAMNRGGSTVGATGSRFGSRAGCPTIMCNTYDEDGEMTAIRYVKCCPHEKNCCFKVMK
jgi:hypothetical protein